MYQRYELEYELCLLINLAIINFTLLNLFLHLKMGTKTYLYMTCGIAVIVGQDSTFKILMFYML